MAQRKSKTPGYIEYGSTEHEALLNSKATTDPEAQAKLEAALNAGEPPTMNEVNAKRKTPINKYTWPKGRPMFDGWARQG